MNEKPVKMIMEFYNENISKNFTDHGILGWESHKNHIERFKVFIEHIPFQGKKILDVGCGLGNLYDYLQEKWLEPLKYTGVDILECMIEIASERNKEQEFICADIFKNMEFAKANRGNYDIIVSSGIFNLDLGNNFKFLEKAIYVYRELRPEYIALNFLDADIVEEDKRFWLVKADAVESIVNNIIPENKSVKIVKGRPIGDIAVIIRLQDMVQYQVQIGGK